MAHENKRGYGGRRRRSVSKLSEVEALTMKFDNQGMEELVDLKADYFKLIDDYKTELENLESEVTYSKQLHERYNQVTTCKENQVLSSEEEQDIAQLESLLSCCNHVTGIALGLSIQAYTVKSLDEHDIAKRYKLYVLCVEIEVKIIADVKMDMRDADNQYKITNLELQIMNKTVDQQIRETLNELEESRDLVNAIRFLASYGFLSEQRTNIFTRLSESEELSQYITFPDSINGENMVIYDPDWASVRVNVKWQIKHNHMFRAESDFNIYCSVSRSKASSSSRNFLEDIPSLFKKLLQKEGEEGALKCLVRMVKT